MTVIKSTIVILLGALALSSTATAQSMAFLSDTDRVRLAIDEIRTAVRTCSTEKMMEVVGSEMLIGSDTLSNADVSILADSIFAEA